MKQFLIVSAFLALAAPDIASAELSYSDFEISLVDIDVDRGPFHVDGDGIELAGRYGFDSRFFILGRWQDQDLDFGVDGRLLELGAGLHHALSSSLDFVATLTYIDTKLESRNASVNDNGLAISGGIRTQLGDSFQVDASLKLIDLDDSGTDTGISIGGHYYFNDTMAVGATADFGDDVDALRIGFRIQF